MRFGPPPERRETGDSALPMINVALLLLVFFLIAATIGPPPALRAIPPTAATGEALAGPRALELDVSGVLAWGAKRGDAALAAFAEARRDAPAAEPALLRADHAAPGAEVARIAAALARLGVRDLRLVVRPAP